jgi:hypothetical protein
MQSLIQSKWLQTVVVGLAALLVLGFVFELGMTVGIRKASHVTNFCNGYPRMFGHRPPGMFGGPGNGPDMGPGFGSHGVFGKVLSVSGNTVIVQSKDLIEQDVLVTSSTKIRLGNEEFSLQEVHPGEDAAVFGVPNDLGQIEARLIRMLGNR